MLYLFMLKNINHVYRHKFHVQKNMAATRGVVWDLTFDEWFKIWTDSNHLEDRGRGKDQYCMSRYGDVGPYSVSNVFIQLHGGNTTDSHKGKPKLSMRGKPANNRLSWADMSESNRIKLYSKKDPRVPAGWKPVDKKNINVTIDGIFYISIAAAMIATGLSRRHVEGYVK
jgi:hypothetical protein